MANTFKPFIDRSMWISTTPMFASTGAGYAICSDMRNNDYANPFLYIQLSTTNYRYSTLNKSWQIYGSLSLAGSNSSGATNVFVPSFSSVGTIAAGSTTTSVVLSTALNSIIGLNTLANHGKKGFYIRIIDTTAGKTVEREIVANTASSTPTITVNSSFGFTPSTGSRYEILAGRVFYLNSGTVNAGIFKFLNIGENVTSGNLTTLNLPTSITTDSSMIALDEQYVPYDCKPGEGMIKGTYEYTTGLYSLTATASGASSITGQATNGDASVVVNEYRNYQIRIVEDTVTPAAVGQRRIISSHTAGPSSVYTLTTAWTTTPSSSAKFVIELPNLILLRTSSSASIFVYNYTDATITNANATALTSGNWSTSYFGNAPTTSGTSGFWIPSWGIQPDPAKLSRQSFCYWFRGSGSNNIDMLDISGANNGLWFTAVSYDGSSANLTNGSCGTYSPFGFEGRMGYIMIHNALNANTFFRFDVKNRVLMSAPAPDDIQSGTGVAVQRLAAYAARDGSDLYDIVFLISNGKPNTQELIPLV